MFVMYRFSTVAKDLQQDVTLPCATCREERPHFAWLSYHLADVFWIPIWSRKRRLERVCRTCGTAMTVPLTSVAPSTIRNNIPLFHRFGGAILIAILAGGVGISELINGHAQANALASPRVGDGWVVDANAIDPSAAHYSTEFTISGMDDDGFWFCNSYLIPASAGAPAKCSSAPFRVSQANVQRIRTNGLVKKIYLGDCTKNDLVCWR